MSRTCQCVSGEPQPARYRWPAASSSISSSSETRLASFKSGPFDGTHLRGGNPDTIKLSTYQLVVPVKLKKRSRGRPPREGGVDPVVGVRMPPEEGGTSRPGPQATGQSIAFEGDSSARKAWLGDRRKAAKAERRSCPRISAPAAPAETESRLASRLLSETKSGPNPPVGRRRADLLLTLYLCSAAYPMIL